jgi:hypothetical protein
VKARAALFVCVLCSACSEPPAPRVCPPVELVAPDPLSIDAAREAHRWAALRRELRFEEARAPGAVMRLTSARTEDPDACLSELYVAGRILFEHEASFADGLGNQLAPVGPRSPFRRVHEGRFGGPETNGCRSCHWRGGIAGGGGLVDDALLFGDGDAVSSADARNPPALSGVGVIERLAAEMSAELAVLRDDAIGQARGSGANVPRELEARGVRFGALVAHPDGSLDTSGVEGVDADLVVRPFGWKGTVATVREASQNALQIHMGLQTEELVDERAGDTELLGTGSASDPDRDGHARELTSRQLDALVLFLAAQAVPILRPHERVDGLERAADGLLAPLGHVYVDEWIAGRALFDDLGCASCHRPQLLLLDATFVSGGVTLDLATEAEHPRIRYDGASGGYPVFLFSDLRRHDLGDENASTHVDGGVPPRQWLTRPLWGLASSAPWLHDGSAPSLDLAIARHGGEAAESRAAFEALDFDQKGALRIFLMSLRRQWRPAVP